MICLNKPQKITGVVGDPVGTGQRLHLQVIGAYMFNHLVCRHYARP